MSKLKRPDIEPQEMDLKCFMNLMVVLIPMLLISAEFAKVAIIDIKLPEARGSQTNTAVTEQPQEDKSEKLLLTAIITDSVVTLGAKGGFMPSLFYREYHRYLTKDQYDTTIEYTPGQTPINPRTGKEFSVHERYEIYLYTADENRNILRSLYTKFGEMVTDAEGIPVKEGEAKVGDTLYALTNPRHRIIVTNPAEQFDVKPLSAYDELKNRLMKVKERYKDAADGEDIIIAAENEVIYDKIVQIMDAARIAEFPNISIAKLRG
jgi:biopolymer transport protein ExbD